MFQARADDKVHPVFKVAVVAEALRAEGVDPAASLRAAGVGARDLSSPRARVSLNQILLFYRAALQRASDGSFAARAARRFRVSTYGLYGFALLTSADHRRALRFAERYRPLAAPLADIVFRERDGRAEWAITPPPSPQVDAELYRFLVELQFGIQKSVCRDLMGPAFGPIELSVVYGAPSDSRGCVEGFDCPVSFNAPENKFVFNAKWLDEVPQLGDALAHALARGLCDQAMIEFKRRTGVAGEVRETLLGDPAHRASFEAVAARLRFAPRTLRRKLAQEGDSFRTLRDELRIEAAIRRLRDAGASVEEVADALDFAEATNFREAFRRWTGRAPNQFRFHHRAPSRS